MCLFKSCLWSRLGSGEGPGRTPAVACRTQLELVHPSSELLSTGSAPSGSRQALSVDTRGVQLGQAGLPALRFGVCLESVASLVASLFWTPPDVDPATCAYIWDAVNTRSSCFPCRDVEDAGSQWLEVTLGRLDSPYKCILATQEPCGDVWAPLWRL